ncbi:MAG TPA: serine/threonine protein phosphatase [Cryomorphaceae bacterium]|nr:serine/threonine protein phosphatase [Owenweeksia sp.]MBG00510.1 serine/threonine protein phosphatase [Owenweeksia sp.]HAD97028.1 serine/threonine protein phosphatase [Cryomorphaceae bacterium]HBF21538.1 serine/threonine protein phosphatase [Cryomorphaceae bacterium]HCQ17098.1 serine/threonine protein phosphatase [Cryomorphaceae bacterium]|tara:strand:+ start:89 stop:727 length:639 start_codon:yes stop_codon:yes gene_type:complete
MKLLVIGDVHGCYYTLKELVEKHWHPGEEILIQLGDLINKGPHSGKCIRYWQELEKEYQGQTVLLRGNHEQMLLDYFFFKKNEESMKKLVNNIEEEGFNIKKACEWLRVKGLKWEAEGILVTHAGIAKSTEDPFDIKNSKGVLLNRGPLKCLDKVQVVGHTMVRGGKPLFNPKENAWFIDTGAWTKKYLSALSIESNGDNPKVIRQLRSEKD